MTRRRIVGSLVALAAVLAIAAASQAPYAPVRSADALLRLSWRYRAEAERVCRPRTAEELDALAVHMRTPEVCERRQLTYRLTVEIDGVRIESVSLASGGARGDRPVFVFREFPLQEGPHDVEVRFAVHGAGDAAEVFTFAGVVTGRRGRVELLTLEPTGRGLVHVAGGAPR